MLLMEELRANQVPETSSTMGDSLYQRVSRISFAMLRGLMGNLRPDSGPSALYSAEATGKGCQHGLR